MKGVRKPRAILFDDETIVLDLLTTFLIRRDYEVFSFCCPIYEHKAESCKHDSPCGDIMITDLRMPRMSGLELLEYQSQRGCRLDIRNKAVISGDMDDESRKRIREMGCGLFPKPFKLAEISKWLQGCEPRFDLSYPLVFLEKRIHARRPFYGIVEYCGSGYEGIMKSQAINISKSGLCLYLFKDHREGESISIQSSLPVDARSATIRWTRRLRDSFWMAGLMFA